MLTSKSIGGAIIVSSLTLALGQAEVQAGTPLYNRTPNVLIKAEKSVSRGQSDRVVQLLGSKVEGFGQPDHRSMAYGYLCTAYFQKEDYIKAESYCDKAVTAGKSTRIKWNHYNNRGVMRFKLARYRAALADFKKAASMMVLHASAEHKRDVRSNIDSVSEHL